MYWFAVAPNGANVLLERATTRAEAERAIRRLYSDGSNYRAEQREWMAEEPDPLCDFCSSKPVVLRLVVKTFRMEQIGTRRSDTDVAVHTLHGDWFACAECSVLVKANRRGDLLERSARLYLEGRGLDLRALDQIRSAIATLHDGLWNNWSGETRPVVPEGGTS